MMVLGSVVYLLGKSSEFISPGREPDQITDESADFQVTGGQSPTSPAPSHLLLLVTRRRAPALD